MGDKPARTESHPGMANPYPTLEPERPLMSTRQERRERAKRLFAQKKEDFLCSQFVTAEMVTLLKRFRMELDGGTRRRGCCDHKRYKIGISSAMVDGGVSKESLEQVIIHELTHACLPKAGHGREWVSLNLQMGGSGNATCTDESIRAAIGYVRCSASCVTPVCPAEHPCAC